MSALDLDALERLTRAYADAHAAMLADDRSAQAWLDDEAASKALAAHYGGQWASPAQCVDVLALITRLRAAEARTAWNFDLDAAPLHDTRMLVCLREPMDNPWEIRVAVARFDPVIGFWLTDSGRRIDPPLAWAPLPAAPEAP